MLLTIPVTFLQHGGGYITDMNSDTSTSNRPDCACGNGQAILEPVRYDTGFAGWATYDPGTCGDCADLTIASDLWKDEYGSRPRHLTDKELLDWYHTRER